MLSKQQAERIEAAVRDAEERTSCEIAVGIVPSSGDDRGVAAIVGALAFVLLASGAPTVWWNIDRLTWTGTALAAGILVFWLCDWIDLGLRCLPARLVVKDARRAARSEEHTSELQSQSNL